MAVLDILVIGVVCVSMLVGIMRGFMYEAAMIFGWVLASLVAKWLAPTVAELFVGAIPQDGWRMGAAFSAVFIAVLFANSILAFLLKSIFSKSALRPLDRLLGSLFGFLRAGVVLLVVALVIHILHMQEEPWWTEAKTAPLLNGAVVTARPYVRSLLNLDDEDLAQGVQQLNDLQRLSQIEGLGSDQNEKSPENEGSQGNEHEAATPAERERALLELLRSRQ